MEFALLNKDVQYKPSAVIRKLAIAAEHVWKFFGRWFARLSSFLALIEWKGLFKDLWKAYENLFVPTRDLILSPLYALIAYDEQTKQYKHPYAVYLGSAATVGAVAFSAHYFGLSARLFHFAWPHIVNGYNTAYHFVFHQ